MAVIRSTGGPLPPMQYQSQGVESNFGAPALGSGSSAGACLARSGFARAVIAPPSAGTHLLVLADSIWTLETAPRAAGGIVKALGPANWKGWTAQGIHNTNSEAVVVFKQYAGTDATFNQRVPRVGVGGGALTATTYLAGNLPCDDTEIVLGATPPADGTNLLYFQPSTTFPWRNGPWWQGQAVRARLIYAVKNNDNFGVRVRGSADGGSTTAQTLTDAPTSGDGSVEVRTLDVSCGTPVVPGGVPRLTVQVYADGVTSNANRSVAILGCKFYLACKHGLEMTIVATQGWGLLDHGLATVCSDAVRKSFLDALGRPNAVLSMIGANLKGTAGAQETGGGNLEAGNYTNFKVNAQAMIDKYRTLLGQLDSSLATVPWCLMSPYKTAARSDTELQGINAAYAELANEMVNVAHLNGTIRLSGRVQTSDGTHPNTAGAEALAAGLDAALRSALAEW